MINELPTPLERDLFLYKEVNQESTMELSKEIISINNSDTYISSIYAINGIVYTPKPINIWIDSYGGNTYQCFGLVSLIENSKTPISTIVTGCAFSSAFLIAISGHKGLRFGYNKSTWLNHSVYSEIEGSIKDIHSEVFEAKRLQTIFEKVILENTIISKKELKKTKSNNTDTIYSAKQAIEKLICDKIL